MQLSKNKLILHLSENERFQVGEIVFVECKGLMEFYKELTNRNSNIQLSRPEKTNWQTIQIELQDLFENLLRFNETQ